MKYALFWSGGKDSLLALDRGRRFGLDIQALVNLYEGNSGRVRFHGVRKELIAEQAKALGLELFQRNTHPESFEEAFLLALQELKERGFDGIVFGNIHLADIRAWYEQRTTAQGFQHIEPLWGCPPSSLVREFIDRGHQARIVSVYLTCGRREWIGRDISEGFVAELEQIENVDVCGERGEYHSFAFAGPAFRTPLELRNLSQFEMENHLILDIDLAAEALLARIG
jgi:diphthine-ammonia ligase